MSTPAQPLAYTDAEVSSLLRVSKRTVYRLRRSGALPAVHIGRAVRTPAGALAQFLERAGKREQAAEVVCP
jgi:excisionase family DNA binding protein